MALRETLNLVATYRRALREEPRVRAYLTGQLIDDIGTAVSLWGGQLIMASIFVDQRTRATVMIPILVSSFFGIAIGGPLADWIKANTPADLVRLARWRWKLVVLGRTFETTTLAILIYYLTLGQPTASRLLPYFIVSTFVRTGLISTRVTFEVDLLQKEEVQKDANGDPILDERGQPRMYKVHLLFMVSVLAVLNATATLGGLLLGGQIMATVGDHYWLIFVVDVLTNTGYIVIIFLACHPAKAAGKVRLSDLGRDPDAPPSERGFVAHVIGQFTDSVRGAARFLGGVDQRPLLLLFIGGVMLDAAAQTFGDKMVMKQLVKVSDEALRHSELYWSLLAICFPLALPMLQSKVSSLGKLFIFAMVIDGLSIAMVGRLSELGALAPVIPLVLVLGVDRGFNVTSKTLIQLAQNSASSPAMRGRISGAFLLAITITNILVQLGATGVSEQIGIPRMIFYAGFAQVAGICALAFFGRKTLWQYGLETDHRVDSS